MSRKSLISIGDFTKEEILHVLETAKEFEQNRVQNFLEGKVIASLFFEPSTRTRLSFETAINRLGAKVIGFSDASNTSQSKGETLKDTIKMVSNYVDMIVMRHPLEGSSRYASEEASVPVVNAGDGANQHPSQTLLDLYSILQTQGTLEGLTINMVGDLKYGRTTHSLLQAMSHFNPKFIFTAPEELKMPKEYKEFLDEKGIEYIETTSLDDYLNDCDILYMTRVQQERFTDPMEYERVKDVYRLEASMLGNVRDNMKTALGSSAPNIAYKQRMPNLPYLYADADLTLTWRNLGRKGNHLGFTYDNHYMHSFSYYSSSIGANKNDYVVPTQFSHNVALSYSICNGRYNVALECKNLTNARLYDNFSLQKAGRAFYAKFRIHFGN